MELNTKQVNDLIEWFKENNPYVQVRQSKLLKHLFIVLAEEDDKYIEYDFGDYNFYYSPKKFLKENSKPITNGLAVNLCLKEFKSIFQLSKPMVLANNIKDITNIKKINIMEIADELCPQCEYEVELKNEFKLQKCPKCKKPIVPCSICPANYEGCNECVLSKACDFLENPDSEPNIEEYNEMYCCDDRENIPQDILIALDYIAENGIE